VADYGINRDHEVSADATDLKQRKSGFPNHRFKFQKRRRTVKHGIIADKIPVTQASALRVAADTPAIAQALFSLTAGLNRFL